MLKAALGSLLLVFVNCDFHLCLGLCGFVTKVELCIILAFLWRTPSLSFQGPELIRLHQFWVINNSTYCRIALLYLGICMQIHVQIDAGKAGIGSDLLHVHMHCICAWRCISIAALQLCFCYVVLQSIFSERRLVASHQEAYVAL